MATPRHSKRIGRSSQPASSPTVGRAPGAGDTGDTMQPGVSLDIHQRSSRSNHIFDKVLGYCFTLIIKMAIRGMFHGDFLFFCGCPFILSSSKLLDWRIITIHFSRLLFLINVVVSKLVDGSIPFFGPGFQRVCPTHPKNISHRGASKMHTRSACK